MTVPATVAAMASEEKARQGRALDALEARLIAAWSDAWEQLEPEFEHAITEILTPRAAGDRLRPSTMARSRRLAQALEQARDRVTSILTDHGARVEDQLPGMLDAALAGHHAMVAAQLPPAGTPGLTIAFDQVSRDALDWIVTRTLDRVHALSIPLPAEVEVALRRALVRGVAVGDNPVTVARDLIAHTGTAFNGGLPRAVTIARTEMLDATRAAEQAWEETNPGVMAGWAWVAALDSKCCAACLAMHGTEHPPEESGPDGHPRCRCARVPRTRSWEDLGIRGLRDTRPVIQTGEEWLGDQDDTTVTQILGPTRADLWRTGRADLSDMVTVRDNPDWRRSHTLTPIRDLPVKEATAV